MEWGDAGAPSQATFLQFCPNQKVKPFGLTAGEVGEPQETPLWVVLGPRRRRIILLTEGLPARTAFYHVYPGFPLPLIAFFVEL